jgi:uncharacterized RDD family membrane protein YckC
MESPANKYTLVINGKPEGPFTIEQLKERQIKPGDFVRTAAMDDYKEAHEIAELRTLLGFNKQAMLIQYFGSFDQRLLASALDWFFVSGVFILIACIVAVIFNDRMVVIILAGSLLVVIPLAKFIYHIVMESSAKQGTYGKQIVKIKVCDLQGNRLSVAHAAGRNLAKMFSVLPLFTGYLLSFFTKQQQCLHDIIAGTLVMKDRLF